jgi:hypothetical protein
VGKGVAKPARVQAIAQTRLRRADLDAYERVGEQRTLLGEEQRIEMGPSLAPPLAKYRSSAQVVRVLK